jgi:hypothetical protein
MDELGEGRAPVQKGWDVEGWLDKVSTSSCDIVTSC